jgi:hypothetical protein
MKTYLKKYKQFKGIFCFLLGPEECSRTDELHPEHAAADARQIPVNVRSGKQFDKFCILISCRQ